MEAFVPFFNRLRSGNDASKSASPAITGVHGFSVNRFRDIAFSVLLASFAGATVSQAQQSISADTSATTGPTAVTTARVTAEAPKPNTMSVYLIADGTARTVTTTAGTVGKVLIQERIALGKLDRVSSRITAPVKDGMEIRVVRVRHEKTVEQKPIPFATRQRYSPSLGVGKKAVVTPGKEGVRVLVYKDSFKDGKRTERIKVSERVTKPRTQVVMVGVRGMTLASRGYFANKRMVEMVATGYGPGENGRWGAMTASGLRPGHGVVAVDPRFIPLGTRLYVDGYGYCVAGDTGGAIKGNRIDLGMDSRRAAMQVGRRRVRVLILD
jgi:3D (Asp-Asp-Asp) domain-containing protein